MANSNNYSSICNNHPFSMIGISATTRRNLNRIVNDPNCCLDNQSHNVNNNCLVDTSSHTTTHTNSHVHTEQTNCNSCPSNNEDIKYIALQIRTDKSTNKQYLNIFVPPKENV